MEETHDRARLVDAVDSSRAVIASIPRSEIEGVLKKRKGQPELTLELATGEAEVEAHRRKLSIDWERDDLKELLRRSTGDDVKIVFDERELQKLLEDEVEAHGLKETMAVLAVAAAAAGASAGASAAMTGGPALIDGGAGSGVATAPALVSDSASSGAEAVAPAPAMISDAASSGSDAVTPAPAMISDAASSGSEGATRAPQMVSDAASSGAEGITPAPAMISDAASSGSDSVAQAPQFLSDAASSGAEAVSPAPAMISDAASSAPSAQQSAATDTGGGISLTTPAARTGEILGATALLVTAAGFTLRQKRRESGRFAQ